MKHMANASRRPRPQRIISNTTGLFFKNGYWAAYAKEATIFPTVKHALLVRNLFDLQHITLIPWPEHYHDPLTSN